MGHPSRFVSNAVFARSPSGQLEARYPYGNAPGGTSGGTSSLFWQQPNGFGYGNQIILTSPNGTKNFGNIGSYRVFDTFEGVPLGNAVSPTNSIFNDTGLAPVAMSNPLSASNRSLRVWDGATSAPRQGILRMPQTQEFMMSCNVWIPSGTRYPGATAVRTFPSGSFWKTFWFFIEDRNDDYGNGFGPHGNASGFPGPSPSRTGQGNDNDLIAFNWGGSDFSIDGNDISQFISLGDYPAVNPKANWVWDEQNRLTFWIRADPTAPTTGNSQAFAQISNSSGTFEYYWSYTPVASYNPAARPVFSNTTGTRHWWEWAYFTGWSGNYTGSNSIYDPRFSQLMLAADPTCAGGARAKVEVSNSATYAGGQLTDVEVISWSPTQVVLDNFYDMINPALPVYLYQTLPGTGAPVRNAFGRIN